IVSPDNFDCVGLAAVRRMPNAAGFRDLFQSQTEIANRACWERASQFAVHNDVRDEIALLLLKGTLALDPICADFESLEQHFAIQARYSVVVVGPSGLLGRLKPGAGTYRRHPVGAAF